MNYLHTPDGDTLSIFDICQAHQQLEADYNVDGWLRERPSNQRRRESTSCQLARLKYNDPYRHVDIDGYVDPEDRDVQFIYLSNVLNWRLPCDQRRKDVIRFIFAREYLEKHHPWVLES